MKMSTSVVLFDGPNGQLWVTNGTAAGTHEISVAGANTSQGFYPGGFTEFDGKVWFAGDDAQGGSGLWVTDGTAAGTSELSVSVQPGNMTVFGSELVFEGIDASGHLDLWVTDGTAAGTSELSVNYSVLSPITVFGSELLFAGGDASGNINLWVSNGTAAGTSELSVAGASFIGLQPDRFVVFGSEVLFEGEDVSGHFGLWVTNGTAAGTSELSVAGAASGGLLPGGFTVFGSEVLFRGVDASGNSNLWVTNGTAAGTSELSVAGAASGGLQPGDFTVFGSEVLFSGNGNLWATDGTAAGTSEIIGAASSNISDLTVLGSKVLFTDFAGLWVSDGTAAGTSEISPVGASPAGFFPAGLEVFGSEVLFTGRDANDLYQLWETDGTSAGTSEVAQLNGTSAAFYGTTVTVYAPFLNTVTASPASGVAVVGQTITLTLDFNDAVTVSGGTPTLALNDAGTASYDAAATAALGDPTKLVFTYTVGASDGNVNELAVIGGSFNGATILSAAGTPEDMSNLSTSFPNLAVATSPELTSVTASQTSGTLHTGQTITLTANFNLPMTVFGGTPELFLNDGGTATYDAAATAALGDPTKMVFDYTVAASDGDVSALAVTGGGYYGATVRDVHYGEGPNVPGLLTTFSSLAVATHPVVTSLTASPASGVEGVGQTITFTMAMSEAVTVTGGTPFLFLNDGGTATYNAAATAALGDPTRLVFSYTVGASDHNVSSLMVTGASLNGATIVDAAGNGLTDASAVYTTFANLGVQAAPNTTVTAVTASSNLVSQTGQVLQLTLMMSKPVTVSGGTPSLSLNDGGTAIYDAAATAALGDPTKLVFDYTAGASDVNESALQITGGSLNGALAVDAAGNVPDFSGAFALLPPPIQVNFVPATVSGVTVSPTSGEVTTGQVVTITVDFSAPISGGGGLMYLNDGATATYDAARSTATALAYDYTVGANDVTTDLAVSGFSWGNILLGEGPLVTDTHGNGAILTGAGAGLGLQVNTPNSGPAGPGTGSFVVPSPLDPHDSTTMEIIGPSAAALSFAPDRTQLLKLDDSQAFTGTVAGLGGFIEQIDLVDIGFSSQTTLGYAPNSANTGGTLTVSDGTHTANIALIGSFTASSFVMGGNLNGVGTLITDPPAQQAMLAQPNHT
jgi:ELWxxDGT repeat protein